MKKLQELTLKEYTDLRRSGLMLIVFPDATGDFREDCEEVKKVKDKCEWKDGKFEPCDAWCIHDFCGEMMNERDEPAYDFCPFCGADIRNPEPAQELQE